MTSMDPMDTATCYFAQVPQKQRLLCLLHKIQAGPQLCSLLCASGQCGGCALSCHPGVSSPPQGLTAQSSCCLFNSTSQVSCEFSGLELLCEVHLMESGGGLVQPVVVPETLLDSPSLITTYTRSIRLQQRCGSELVLLQTKLIATQNTIHP
jgi:hypothetical protein